MRPPHRERLPRHRPGAGRVPLRPAADPHMHGREHERLGPPSRQLHGRPRPLPQPGPRRGPAHRGGPLRAHVPGPGLPGHRLPAADARGRQRRHLRRRRGPGPAGPRRRRRRRGRRVAVLRTADRPRHHRRPLTHHRWRRPRGAAQRPRPGAQPGDDLLGRPDRLALPVRRRAIRRSSCSARTATTCRATSRGWP